MSSSALLPAGQPGTRALRLISVLWAAAVLVSILDALFALHRAYFQYSHPSLDEQSAQAAAIWLRQEPANARLLLFRMQQDKSTADVNPIWYNYRLNYLIYPRRHGDAWDRLPPDAAQRCDLILAFGSAQNMMPAGWAILHKAAHASLLAPISAPHAASRSSLPAQPASTKAVRIIAGIASLLVVTALGAFLLGITTRKPPFDVWWANLAIAHLIGATALTWLVTILAILSGHLLIWPVYLLLLLLLPTSRRAWSRIFGSAPTHSLEARNGTAVNSADSDLVPERARKAFTLQEIALMAVIGLGLILIFLRGWLLGVGWDGYSIWQFKAQAFTIDGDLSVLRDPLYSGYAHMDYPLLVPLQTWWTAAHAGAYGERWAQTIGLLFTLDLAAIFVAFARRRVSRDRILLGLTLLATLPDLIGHAVSGFADIEMACYLLMLGVFLARVLIIREAEMLPILIWTFAGIVLVKNEGLLACVAGLLVLLFAWRGKSLAVASRCAAGAAIAYLPWLLLKRVWRLNNDLMQPAVRPHFTSSLLAWRLRHILLATVQGLLPVAPTPNGPKPSGWGLLILLIPVGVAASIRRHIRICRPLWQLCAVQLIGYCMIYLITPQPLMKHMASSLDRLLLHIVPTLLLASLLGCFAEQPVDEAAPVSYEQQPDERVPRPVSY